MINGFGAALSGVVLVVVCFITGALVGQITNTQKLNECEKHLPRTEECVLVAVPVSKE